MSFRLFVYYCALVGGWAACIGGALGLAVVPSTVSSFWTGMLRSGLLGLTLGLAVAFGLGLLDAAWNLSLRHLGPVIGRVLVACAIGAVGGLVAGGIGQSLVSLTSEGGGIVARIAVPISFVIGWTLTGLVVGFAVGAFELLSNLLGGKNVGAAMKKVVKCTLGGTIGGLIGGILFVVLQFFLLLILSNKSPTGLWSPTLAGFVIIGLLIGLLIGLAQIILKDAWVRVEAGFRPGREMLLAKEATTVGRAEGTDIPLFGDNGVEKQHARIVKDKDRFFLVLDDSTPAGTTFVNESPVGNRSPLASGDLIKLGNKSLLRFFEKTKK